MAPAIPDPENDDYDSAADSDFGGSVSPSSGDDSSGSDSQGKKGTKSSGRRKRSIEDSGDEGVVKEGKKKRRKRDKATSKDTEEGTEESAIGMRVRDRKLGRAAEQEKKPLASSEGATVDVNALWARMNSSRPKVPLPPPTNSSGHEGPGSSDPSLQQRASFFNPANGASEAGEQQASPQQHLSEATIVIKRTYKFAGETITEEKVVPKSSAEARVYLESQAAQVSPSPVVGGKPIRRPMKKKSMFEPNPDGHVKGLVATPSKGPKLNTIEKSKLDWASHVDKEGLKEELDVAEKAKGGYLGRMDFLGRSEAKREEDLKNAKKR